MTVTAKLSLGLRSDSKLCGNSDLGAIKQKEWSETALHCVASYAHFSLSVGTLPQKLCSGIALILVQFNAYYNAVSTRNGLRGKVILRQTTRHEQTLYWKRKLSLFTRRLGLLVMLDFLSTFSMLKCKYIDETFRFPNTTFIKLNKKWIIS